MDRLPAELVVADADSTDGTVEALRVGLKAYPGRLVVLAGKCSISEGRNKAIRAARNRKIVITDFGVTFHPAWLGKLSNALDECTWVGGCYEMVGRNAVERSFCRLFNVPTEQLNEATFLPSSRSFGLTKEAFEQVGGYNESLMIGEDTEFVLRLKATSNSYRLVRDAIVFWTPRSTISAVYLQNFRYAYWDGIARQNRGRWTHFAFLLFLLCLPCIGASVGAAPGVLLGLLASASALFLKVRKNTRRSGAGTPSPLDLLLYLTILLASCHGYLRGTAEPRASAMS
jgi:glycosyltransferase involved in cell wall biosynthesis